MWDGSHEFIAVRRGSVQQGEELSFRFKQIKCSHEITGCVNHHSALNAANAHLCVCARISPTHSPMAPAKRSRIGGISSGPDFNRICPSYHRLHGLRDRPLRRSSATASSPHDGVPSAPRANINTNVRFSRDWSHFDPEDADPDRNPRCNLPCTRLCPAAAPHR